MHRVRKHWAALTAGVLLGAIAPAVNATAAHSDTPLPPSCTTSSYGFAGATDLTFNGRAAVSGDRLRVTYAAYSGAGSAFTTNKIALHDNGSFSTRYSYQVSDPGAGGADGLVFTVQNVDDQVGSIGGGLGYQGIPNSIGVELDDWYNAGYDINENHVGIDVNGDISSVVEADLWSAAGINLDAGGIGYVWVDYDGSTDLLEVRVASSATRPAGALLSHTLDLPGILGSAASPAEDAYIGFTAATGAAYANFDVLDWTFNNCYQPVGVDQSPVVDAGGPYSGHKAVATTLAGSVSDDEPGVTQQWSVTDQPAGSSCSFGDPAAVDTAVTCDTSGSYELTLAGSDSIAQQASDTATLTISNRAPVAGDLDLAATGPCDVDATVHFTDADASDAHTVSFDWGDGSSGAGTVDQAADTGSGSHTYAGAGTYDVTATVSDGEDSDDLTTSYATRNEAGAFLAPINAGGTHSVFRTGSTIPVKIVVTDCDGMPVTTLAPVVHLDQVDGTVAGDVNEAEVDEVATNGRRMAWTEDHYQFNLSTKRSVFADGENLTAGSYRLVVTDPSLVAPASVVIDLS